MAKWGVWFSGRNTPSVVDAGSRSEAISKAKKKGSTGSKGKVDSAKQLKGSDLKAANKGRWVRTRASGKKTGGESRYRPQFKKSKAVTGKK